MSDFKAKCIKFDFFWGPAPADPLGELTALPQIAVFKGLLLRRGRRKRSAGGEREEGNGREGEERENDRTHLLSQIYGYATDIMYAYRC